MHHRVAEAIQIIDAAVCNGDTFDDKENREELLNYLRYWLEDLRSREQETGK